MSMRIPLTRTTCVVGTVAVTTSILAVTIGSAYAADSNAHDQASIVAEDLPPSTPAPASRETTNSVVATLNNSGAGSLRSIIRQANKRAKNSVTTVTFDVVGTIVLDSDLPSIKRTITLDATTAPGYVAGGAPVVGLDAHNNRAIRLAAGAAGSRILGLAITNASSHGITLTSGRNLINFNYIGVTVDGAEAGNRGAGIYAERTSRLNTIGQNPSAWAEP